MDRRTSIKLLALGGAAAAVPGCTPDDVDRASAAVQAREPDGTFSEYDWTVLSESERKLLSTLVDDILPADDGSGSASEARVPEFIDFMAQEHPELQTRLRGGLAWLDREARAVFVRHYTECSAQQRGTLLDRIAWPESAADGDLAGVKFFSMVRDLTASGFWSSEMGMADVGYMGNTPNPEWTGCSPEANAHAARVGG